MACTEIREFLRVEREARMAHGIEGGERQKWQMGLGGEARMTRGGGGNALQLF